MVYQQSIIMTTYLFPRFDCHQMNCLHERHDTVY